MMIICQIDGRAGSLYELLGDFACRKVNMTRIESRPARTSLGDIFFSQKQMLMWIKIFYRKQLCRLVKNVFGLKTWENSQYIKLVINQ